MITLKTDLSKAWNERIWLVDRPRPDLGVTNAFDDNTSGAKGFTKNMRSTQYLGITENDFTYPKSVEDANGGGVARAGGASIQNQLPNGTTVRTFGKFGNIQSKTTETGYSVNRKYEEQESGNLKLYTQNDSAFLKNIYTQRNLQTDSFNSDNVKSPYVLRGIQNPKDPKPKRWGNTELGEVTSPFFQAGIKAYGDRVVSELKRSSDFIRSNKGKYDFAVRMAALALMNPSVQKTVGSTLLGLPRTKIFAAPSILASIARPVGTPLVNSIGIPYLAEGMKYEKVVNRIQDIANTTGIGGNRLSKLRIELGLAHSSVNVGRILKNSPPGLVSRAAIEKSYNASNAVSNAISNLMPIKSLSGGIGGPNSYYGLGIQIARRYYNSKSDAVKLNDSNNFIQPYNIAYQYNSVDSKGRSVSKSADRNKYSSLDIDSQQGSLNKNLPKKDPSSVGIPLNLGVGKNPYYTISYSKIPKNTNQKQALKGDFRNGLEKDLIGNRLQKDLIGFTGKYISPFGEDYYKDYNLETKRGIGQYGKPGIDRRDADKFLAKGIDFGKKPKTKSNSANKNNTQNRDILSKNPKFRGDKINALDVNLLDHVYTETLYPNKTEDFIKFFFQDGDWDRKKDENKAVMVFRATIQDFNDTFIPTWNPISVLGRPDGAYVYTKFERKLDFTFRVAATSRTEMIPIWRKINYLTSYSMPEYHNGDKPSGPFMRVTIGDIFYQTPMLMEKCTVNIPNDSPWDIAYDVEVNKDAKQLPMVVDISMSFIVINEFRQQLHGRTYSLSRHGCRQDRTTQWLQDTSLENVYKNAKGISTTPNNSNSTPSKSNKSSSNNGVQRSQPPTPRPNRLNNPGYVPFV